MEATTSQACERRGEQTLGEEIANAITHGAGLALAIAGLVVLVYQAATSGTARHTVSVSVYGVTLVLLYLASTLYHAAQHPEWKRLCRIFDHTAIFLLIAGTYTPFTLVTLRGGWGWSIFGIVWGLCFVGILYKLLARGRFKRRWLSIGLYVAMGWVVVIAIKPLFDALPPGGLAWLMGGGAFYTGGVLFYVLDHKRFFHTVWHLFVLGGSVCHYLAILFYVLPAS